MSDTGKYSLQEIRTAVEELRREPEWIYDLSRAVGESFHSLAKPMFLSCLSAVSASLPPISYAPTAIRSKLHLLLQGHPGAGKGGIMTVLSMVAPRTQSLGLATGAALLGTITKSGEWVPGKAYYARDGVLLIRELWQSMRHGEHYSDMEWDFNELLEYPHEITKSLGSFRFANEKIEELKIQYPGLEIPHDNEFRYSAPCAVIAGVPNMPVDQLSLRVSAGFLSRFLVLSLNYDKDDTNKSIANFWNYVALPGNRTDPSYIRRYSMMFSALNLINLGFFGQAVDIPPIRGFDLRARERERISTETRRAAVTAWDQVEKAFPSKNGEQTVTPPVLFRQVQDVLRIACAQAASRRFSVTEEQSGIIRIDNSAIDTALDYLPLIVDNAVWQQVSILRTNRSIIREKPSIFWQEYEIIRLHGEAGIEEEAFFGICCDWGRSRETAERRLKRLLEESLVTKKPDERLVLTRHLNKIV